MGFSLRGFLEDNVITDLINPNTRADQARRAKQGKSREYVRGQVSDYAKFPKPVEKPKPAKIDQEQVQKDKHYEMFGTDYDKNAREKTFTPTERIDITKLFPEKTKGLSTDLINYNQEILDQQIADYDADRQKRVAELESQLDEKSGVESFFGAIANKVNANSEYDRIARLNAGNFYDRGQEEAFNFGYAPGESRSTVEQIVNPLTGWVANTGTQLFSALPSRLLGNLIEALPGDETSGFDIAGRYLKESADNTKDTVGELVDTSRFTLRPKEGESPFLVQAVPGAGSIATSTLLTATGHPYAATALFGGMAGEQALDEANEAGLSPWQSLGVAGTAGLVEGVLEQKLNLKFIGNSGSKLVNVLNRAKTEATQEFAQSLGGSVVSTAYQDIDVAEVTKQAFTEAGYGGVLGSGTSIALDSNTVQKIVNDPNFTEALKNRMKLQMGDDGYITPYFPNLSELSEDAQSNVISDGQDIYATSERLQKDRITPTDLARMGIQFRVKEVQDLARQIPNFKDNPELTYNKPNDSLDYQDGTHQFRIKTNALFGKRQGEVFREMVADGEIVNLKNALTASVTKSPVAEFEQTFDSDNTQVDRNIANAVRDAVANGRVVITSTAQNGLQAKIQTADGERTVNGATQRTLNEEIFRILNSTAEAQEVGKVNFTDKDMETARNAYHWSSMNPDRAGAYDLRSTKEYLESVYADGSEVAKGNGVLEEYNAEFEKFKERYLAQHSKVLSAKSRTASTMVTGAAGFNASRNEKRLGFERNASDKLIEIGNKGEQILDKIARNIPAPVKVGDKGADKAITGELEQLQKLVDEAKQINRQAKKEKLDKFLGNYSKEAQDEAQKNVAYGSGDATTPFPAYWLRNRNAKLKRLKTKAETAQKVQTLTADNISIPNATVEINRDDNRLRVSHDTKPDQSVIDDMKRLGLRWSPKNKAWQAPVTPRLVQKLEAYSNTLKGAEKMKKADQEIQREKRFTEADEKVKGQKLMAELNEVKSPDGVTVVEARKRASELLKNPTYRDNSPERIKLREKIADDYYKSQGDLKQEKKLHIVMGKPASAKSNLIAEPLAEEMGAVLLDSDEHKKVLPEFNKGVGAGAVHQESDDIMLAVQSKAMKNGDNLVLAKLGKGEQTMNDIIDVAIAKGYTVDLTLMDISAEESARRTATRYNEKGKFVDPLFVIKHVANKDVTVYNKLIQRKDINSYGRWNNEVPFGQNPTLEESSGRYENSRLGGIIGSAVERMVAEAEARNKSGASEKADSLEGDIATQIKEKSELDQTVYRGVNDVNAKQASPDRPVFYADTSEYAGTYGKAVEKKIKGTVFNVNSGNAYGRINNELHNNLVNKPEYKRLLPQPGQTMEELRILRKERELVESYFGQLSPEQLSKKLSSTEAMPDVVKQVFDDAGIDYIRIPGEQFPGTVGKVGHQTEIIELPKPKAPVESKTDVFDTKTELTQLNRILENKDTVADGKTKIADYYRTEKGEDWSVVKMSPDEYLGRAKTALGASYTDTSAYKSGDVDKYAADMEKGDKFPMPYLNEVRGEQEGRSRALAAKKLGITEIPVALAVKPKAPVESKTEGKKLYHGTALGNDFESFDIELQKSGNRGKAIHLTENKKAAEYFSKVAQEAAELKSDDFRSGKTNTTQKAGDILEFTLSKDAKVLELDKLGQFNDAEEAIENAKADGYDAITFPDDVLSTVEGIDLREAFDKDGNPAKTTIVLNADKLTRSQAPVESTTRLDSEAEKLFIERNGAKNETGSVFEPTGLERIEQFGREYNTEFIKKHPELADSSIVVYHDAVRGDDLAVAVGNRVVEVYDKELASRLKAPVDETPQVSKTPTTIDNVKLPSGYHTVADITKELKRQGITQEMLDDTQAIDMGRFDNSGKVETGSVLYFLKENSKTETPVESKETATTKAQAVYQQLANEAKGKYKEGYQEQAETPNRYHRPEEAANPKGIKIGDKVIVKNKKFGDSVGIAATIQDESDAPGYKGGFSVKVVSPLNYGGFAEIDAVEKISDAEYEEKLRGKPTEPYEVITMDKDNNIVNRRKEVTYPDNTKKTVSTSESKFAPKVGKMTKGSPEAIAWGKKMQAARKKKPKKPVKKPVQTPAPVVTPAQSTKGETGKSKLAQRVLSRAEENDITRGIKEALDLAPEYGKANVQNQAQEAVKYLKENPKDAVKVAMGTKNPPEGLLPESVFIAVENDAVLRGAYGLVRDLATKSTLSVEASGMGQRIRMLAERDADSPIGAIQVVEKAREKRAGKIKNKRKKVTKSLKQSLTDATAKVNWDAFISDLSKTKDGDFHLVDKQVLAFRQALRDGKIDTEALAGMSTKERNAEFGKFLNERSAKKVNTAFERKLLLKNQQAGMINWAKREAGLLPEVKKDLISKVERMEDILTPETEQSFLNDLVDYRLGVGVTESESKQIVELAKIVKDYRTEMENGGDRLMYGAAQIEFHKYVNNLVTEEQKMSLSDIENPAHFAYQSIRKTADTMRSSKSSMDDSAIFRQGWKTMITNPDIWAKNASKTFLEIGQTIKGEDIMDVVGADILSRPNAVNGNYKKMKLAVTNVEEAFPSALPEKIPLFGRLYKASQDVYTAFLYRQRADIADKLLEEASETGVDLGNTAELQAIGELVNSLTGRGDLGRLEPAADTINSVLFSPRLFKSHLDVLVLHPLGGTTRGGASRFTQKQAAKNLVKIAGATGLIMALANAINPEWVEEDPRSADFGKIKIGNTRFDITGGMGSLVTLGSRLITSSSKSSTSGNIEELNTGEFGARDSLDVIYDYFENKLAPAFSTGKTIITKENFEGESPTVGNLLEDAFVPISFQNAQEVLEDPDSANNLLTIIADGLGISTNTYSGDKDWSKDRNLNKTLQQFRDTVGEEVFQEANEAYNQEVRLALGGMEQSEGYNALSQDDKTRFQQKRKNEALQYIFDQYDFKYESETTPIDDIIESIESGEPMETNTDDVNATTTQKVRNMDASYDKYNIAPVPSNETIVDLKTKFDEKVADGRITSVNRDAEERQLVKAAYKSQFDDTTTKFYKLGDADMRRAIQAGNISQRQLDMAIAVDDALTEAGLQPYLQIGKTLRRELGYSIPASASKSSSRSSGGSKKKKGKSYDLFAFNIDSRGQSLNSTLSQLLKQALS